MKKITMEIWTHLDGFGLIWMDLELKVGCIKEKIIINFECVGAKGYR